MRPDTRHGFHEENINPDDALARRSSEGSSLGNIRPSLARRAIVLHEVLRNIGRTQDCINRYVERQNFYE